MVLTDNIVAAYKLENTNDEIGGFNLTNNNSVAFNAAKFNNGGDYGTATNKYLNVANNLGIIGASAFSTSFWVKMNQALAAGSYNTLFYQRTGTSAGAGGMTVLLYYNNAGTKQLLLQVFRSTNDTSKSYNVDLGTSNWYHIVFTDDGTNQYLYVNGVQRMTTAKSGTQIIASAAELAIGYYGNSTGYAAQAIFDDTVVWSRAITSTEVSTIYNSGTGLAYPFGTTPVTTLRMLASAGVGI